VKQRGRALVRVVVDDVIEYVMWLLPLLCVCSVLGLVWMLLESEPDVEVEVGVYQLVDRDFGLAGRLKTCVEVSRDVKSGVVQIGRVVDCGEGVASRPGWWDERGVIWETKEEE